MNKIDMNIENNQLSNFDSEDTQTDTYSEELEGANNQEINSGPGDPPIVLKGVSRYKPQNPRPGTTYTPIPRIEQFTKDPNYVYKMLESINNGTPISGRASIYKLGKGKDDRGEFIELREKDKGEFDPLINGIRNERYDRIYLNDYSDMIQYKDYLSKPSIDYSNFLLSKRENNAIKLSGTKIPLTQGRYSKGSIDSNLIDSLYETAVSEGIDPYDLFAVAGRESTFNKYRKLNGSIQDKALIMSAWTLRDKYKPISFEQFLADKKVPFIQSKKTKYGYKHSIADYKSANQYLKDNPNIINEWKSKYENTPNPDYGGYDAFREVARMIKAGKMGDYNPGDPDYQNKLANEKKLLLQEKELARYINKLKQQKSKPKAKDGALISGNIQVEAEKNELIIENEFGDKVIIPAKKREWAKKQLDKNNHSALDEYISTLPTMADFAEDGSVIPGDPNKKIKVYQGDPQYYVQGVAKRNGVRENEDGTVSTHKMAYAEQDGRYVAYPTLFQNKDNSWQELSDDDNWAALNEATKRKELFYFDKEEDAKRFAEGSWKTDNIKEYDVTSPEYNELYKKGLYDPNNDTQYMASDPVTVTAKAPSYLGMKKNLEKVYTKQWYIDNNMSSLAKGIGMNGDNMSGESLDNYNQFITDQMARRMLDRDSTFKTRFKENRPEALKSFDEDELNIINSSKYASEIGSTGMDKFENFALGMDTSGNKFKSDNTTWKEAKQDAANPLNAMEPLRIPGKLLQSAYKKDYSAKDAVRVKENNAEFTEDLVTDVVAGAVGGIGVKTVGQLTKNMAPLLRGAGADIAQGLESGITNTIRRGETAREMTPDLNRIITPDGFSNRVFNENIQLGKYDGVSHLSEKGYNYRTLSQNEIENIRNTGGVFPQAGKAKGGNTNVKYWTEGNGKNWYGDKDNFEVIRVKQDNFKPNEIVKAENVEIYNKQTHSFEPILSKQTVKRRENLSESVVRPLVSENNKVINDASHIDSELNVITNKINEYKKQEANFEEMRKQLWQDYKNKVISSEDYKRSVKEMQPWEPFESPIPVLEKKARELNVQKEIFNTPQLEILTNKSQLGKNISDGGTNNKGVFELGSNYVARLSAHGYDDASRLLNYAEKIKSPRIMKTRQVKNIDGEIYQVQDRAIGKPYTSLSEEEMKNIPQNQIDNFYADIDELQRNGLNIDISGGKSNIFYDKERGFQFIDLGIGKMPPIKDINAAVFNNSGLIESGVKTGVGLENSLTPKSNSLVPPTRPTSLDHIFNPSFRPSIEEVRHSLRNTEGMVPVDDVSLGNGLILRNNPSRTLDEKSLIGKNRILKKVINSKNTSEYIELKSWTDDDGKIYYYFSANMPSSHLKAGRAFKEIEKFVPKGGSILEKESLSYDSFLSVVNRVKNPNFETFIGGKNLKMNNQAVINKIGDTGTKIPSINDELLGFYNKKDAEKVVIDLNSLLNRFNLPEANIFEGVTSDSRWLVQNKNLKYFGIEIPNIGLKKLYSILGIPIAGKHLLEQNKEQ